MVALQGQVSFDAIAAKPEFQTAPPDVQQDVADRYFNDNIAAKPEFQKATPEVQADVRTRFFSDYKLAPVETLPEPKQPEWVSQLPDEIGYAAATTALPFATAGKALSFDYLDAEKPLLDYARGIEQKYPQDFANDPRRIDSTYSQAGRAVSYGAGLVKNFQALEGLGARGIRYVGGKIWPNTTRLAQAAGVGEALNIPSWLQAGLAGATYEGVKSIPANQLDAGQRAMNAAGGFVGGAALPIAGNALKGSVQATRNIFQGNNAPVGMAELQNALKRASKKQLHETFELLANTVRRIQTGEIDPALVDPNDYAALVQGMDYVGKAIKTGKAIKRPNFARGLARRVEGKAKIRAIKGKRSIEKPKPASTPSTETVDVKDQEPIKATVKYKTVERKVKRKVTVYTDEVQSELERLDAEHKVYKERQLRNRDKEQANKNIKGHALSTAAKKREVIQGESLEPVDDGLTGKELKAKVLKEQSNYSGKAVIVNGKKARVVNAPFGKVKVEFEDGSIQTVEPSNIKPAPKPKPKPTTVVKEIEETVVEEVPDNTPDESPIPQPKQEKPTLKGAIKEMVRQVEKDANLPEDAGASTAGQVEKKTNRKLTTAERDIHNNLRAIARTEAVDDARGIHQQFEVNPDRQLKYEAIKGQVSQEHQAIAEKLDEAMSQGKAIRVEYAAEEAGRSNEAAKVTNTGNVKVEVTDFTPLHWTLTSGDKAMIHGYNQRGHFVSYHLEPSTNGSQVLKAGKIIDRAFVGEYPNVYLGSRRFLVKDVLGRGVRSADGPVKTSEAIAVAEQTAAIFKAIENNQAIPPEIKRILKKISTGKKATRAELLILQNKFKKPKDIELLQTFCKMMGL